MNVDVTDSPKAKKRRLDYQNEESLSSSQAIGIDTSDTPQSGPRSDEIAASSKLAPSTSLSLADQPVATSKANDKDNVQEEKDAKDKDKELKTLDDDTLDDRLTFPERLMHLLEREVEPKALWWQKDGISFAFEPKLFTEKVLNRLFPTKIKFESFIRKLNRWGFRRVPGQGLPPNGAAYKHPLFKKSEPELMKSMKFGQKVDSNRRPTTSQLPSADEATGMFTGSHPSLSLRQAQQGNQSLLSLHAAPGGQHLSFLQTLVRTQPQQQQQHLPQLATSNPLASQTLAAAGFSGTNDSIGNQMRHSLLLAGMPSTLPSLQMPSTVSAAQGQGLASANAGRRFSAFSSASSAAALSSEIELRNALMRGQTILGSAELQRRISLSAQGTNQRGNATVGGAGLGALRTSVGTAGMAASISDARLDARMLLGGSNMGGLSHAQPQHHTNSALLPPTQVASNLNLLNLQRATSRDVQSDLLLFLEQERQRKQQHERNQG